MRAVAAGLGLAAAIVLALVGLALNAPVAVLTGASAAFGTAALSLQSIASRAS